MSAKNVVSVAILYLVLMSSCSSVIQLDMTSSNMVVAQTVIGEGYYEGKLTMQGAYLQALRCYPLMPVDDDKDGIIDVGCMWDDDKDSVLEPHNVKDPLIVPLETYGFNEGDPIMISYRESVYDTNFIMWGFYLYGLFSRTNKLDNNNWVYINDEGLDWPMLGPLNRVPDAIDASLGGYTHASQDVTWKQGLKVETDIPEDFRITGYSMSNMEYNGCPWSANKYWATTWFWIKVPPGAKYLFLAFSGPWNLGNAGECSVIIDKDSDEDGIPNSWEKDGIDFNLDGNIDYQLTDSNPMHKDIYVEIDYFDGHRPNRVALDDVIYAFKNSPVTNPDKTQGINLHIDIDEKIPHQNIIKVDANTGNWPDFDDIKKLNFGTIDERNSAKQSINPYDYPVLIAKRYTYHYCLFIHDFAVLNVTTSNWERVTNGGVAEPYGNDFIISLGSWTGGIGSTAEQSGTFMHELGHNLGLKHGGSDHINYKPNYLSVMNYLFQLPNILKNRPLTYSTQSQLDLTEEDLNELNGIGESPWGMTAYSAQIRTSSGDRMVPLVVFTSGAIDWNNNGDETETSTWANINYYNIGYPKYDSPNNEVLKSYTDWPNLYYTFQKSKDFEAGKHSTQFGMEEITWEIVQEINELVKEVHNIAITNVMAPNTAEQRGLTVNVTLSNIGGNNETFNVTVYANTITLASATFDISEGNTTTIYLFCNTSNLRIGNYTLSTNIRLNGNETYTADNIMSGGILTLVDRTPPTISISNIPDEVKSSNLILNWVGSDENSGIGRYEIRIDDGAWMSMGTSTSHEFTGLKEGSHIIEVKAFDLSGNSETATINFKVLSSGIPYIGVIESLITIAILTFIICNKKER